MKLRYIEISNLIRNDILSGQFPLNAHLKIDSLATKYNTSHMPVREALRLLNTEGLVIIEPNKGVRVRNFDRVYLENIYDIRIMLEEMQARQAAKNRTKEQLQDLYIALEEFEFFVESEENEKLSDYNVRFHRIISDAAGNFDAEKIWRSHCQLIPIIWKAFGYPISRAPSVIDDHRRIAEAIKLQDAEGAALLAKAHCYKAKCDMLKAFDKNAISTQEKA